MQTISKHSHCAASHGRQKRQRVATRLQQSPRDNTCTINIGQHLSNASALVLTVTVLTRPPLVLAEVLSSPPSNPQEASTPCKVQLNEAPSAYGTQNPLAELSAGIFGGGRETPDERDPITPFTLYGTNFKKYLIEQLQGEKIVSRKKGFTVDACVGAVEVTQETPQFQGLPTGDKALYAKDRVCKKSEGQDLKETCRVACEAACNESLDLHAQQVASSTGFRLLAADQARMAKSCTRNCAYECVKPGKAFDFVIPYRR